MDEKRDERQTHNYKAQPLDDDDDDVLNN